MNSEIQEQLVRIESMLLQLLTGQSRQEQEYYSTADIAKQLGKAEFTVREWCRLGRVHAVKRAAGRGTAKEWMLSHKEVARIKAEGLLPQEPIYRGRRAR